MSSTALPASPGRAQAGSRGRTFPVGRLLLTLASAAVAIIFFLPILWWALASIKPTQEILSVPPKLFGFEPTLNWFRVVLFNVDPTSFNVETTGSVGRGSGGSTFYSIPYLRDSFIIGAGSTLLVLLLATPAAYALSRFRLRRRKDLAFWILSQRMMPPIVAAFPLVFMFRALEWHDTYHGLILVHAAINVPLATLLLMSFFDEVPRDLDDAAMVDGASRFGAFREVVLHYVRGGLAATAVLAFVFSWNEFLLSLVLTTGGIRTVPVASSTFTTAFATEWGYLAALGTASMVPIFVFILFVQRHLVRGLTLGAVK
ncbi:MAG TPA: carbohydrate ABC transporter permease [Thermomicrobiales bacterium]|nr:carbohydrate ABC transporter permease [Thermomicrobiales bacterium]